MIVELFFEVNYFILKTFMFFEIPLLPDEVSSYLEMFFSYLETGASIFANYSPWAYICILFGVMLVVDFVLMIYEFVMWVVRKIPAAGMS